MPILEVIGGTRDVNSTLDYCLKDKTKDPNTKKEINKCILKAGVNCDIDDIHEDFQETRDFFNKDDGRQGMHFTASFSPSELSPHELMDQEKCLQIGIDLANKIARGYESGVFVHVDQDHLHCHIVTNSVDYKTGKKYHMEKNKDLVIIRNQFDQICKNHGIEPLEAYKGQSVTEKSAEKRIKARGKTPWKQEVKNAIGYAKENATSFEHYKELLLEKGIEYYERGERTKGYIHLATQAEGNPKCKIRDRNSFLDNGYQLKDIIQQIETNSEAQNKVKFGSKNKSRVFIHDNHKSLKNDNLNHSVSIPVAIHDNFEEVIKDNQDKKADIKKNTSRQLQEAGDESERVSIKKKEEIELEQAEVDKTIKLKDQSFYKEMLTLFRNIENHSSYSKKKYEKQENKVILHVQDIRKNNYRFVYATNKNLDTFSVEKQSRESNDWVATEFKIINSENDFKNVKEIVQDVTLDIERQNKQYLSYHKGIQR